MLDAEESYLKRYLIEASSESILDKVLSHLDETSRILETLPEEKAGYAYDEGKWTVRQVVGHVLAAHRIFATRALCIARGEQKSLPGFDENVYASDWPPATIGLRQLASAYADEARATRNWIRWMTPEEHNREGEANGIRIRPQQIFRALIGHERHHLQILRERYGVDIAENGKFP